MDQIIQLLQRILPPSADGSVCSWCHLCNHPAGICLFWWIFALLLLLIVLVSLLPNRPKCPYCGTRNRPKAKYCRGCDQQLIASKKKDGDNAQTFIAQPLNNDSAQPGYPQQASMSAYQPSPVIFQGDSNQAPLTYADYSGSQQPQSAYQDAAAYQAPAMSPGQSAYQETEQQAAAPADFAEQLLSIDKICPRCGACLPERALFCSSCGQRLSD